MTESGDRALAALRRAGLAAVGRDPGELLTADVEDYAALEPTAVRAEIEAVLLAHRADEGLERLRASGALEALLPEVFALVGFGEGGRQHKDVWDHTKKVVLQSPSSIVLRWAALLHDIGKVPTRRTSPSGETTFHGHAEVGARMAAKILKRLGFGRDEADRIRRLVLFHLRANQYLPSWTDSAVRRFGREIGDLLDELLDLSRADMTTKYADKKRRGLAQIAELQGRIEAIREADAREPLLPKGFGAAIMERFALRPGPRIGELRAAVEDAIERGELEARAEPELYLAWLADRQDDS